MQPPISTGNTSSPPPTAPRPRETFLDEHQLAQRHQRSVKTLRNDRLRGGGIPFVKLGRLVRYRLSDIEDWENANLRRSTSDRGGKHG